MRVNIPASIGELFDKITILNIKNIKIKDKIKLIEIEKELRFLNSIVSKKKLSQKNIKLQIKKLSNINQKLWNVEDRLRNYEKNKVFDSNFIADARSVYKLNDKRALIKKKINEITGSNIIEIKSYEKY